MKHPDDNSVGRQDEEEREVRRLLANVGTGRPLTLLERERVASKMWATFDTTTFDTTTAEATGTTHDDLTGSAYVTLLHVQRGETPSEPLDQSTQGRPITRIVLWAAILLVAMMAAGLIGKVVGESGAPASPPETDRTTLLIGDTGVSFDAVHNFEMMRLGPDVVTFTGGRQNPSNHKRITIAQAAALFDGRSAESFFSSADVEAEAVHTPPGISAWMVSTGNDACAAGDDCVVLAELADGTPLTIPSYSRVEIHDNGDRRPILVISHVGSPSSSAALVGVELSP